MPVARTCDARALALSGAMASDFWSGRTVAVWPYAEGCGGGTPVCMSLPPDPAFTPARRSFIKAVSAAPLVASAACSRPADETAASHPQVDPAYRHYEKYVTPRPSLELEGARLKWYDMHRREAPIDDAVVRQGHAFFAAEERAGRLELAGDIGFAILHLCGAETFLLMACTWRNENELWESCYVKKSLSAGFELIPRESRHKPTYCVWEMGAVWHEAQAWKRYLVSARDEPARLAYLADRFAGPV
jgi:hypothetical protein